MIVESTMSPEQAGAERWDVAVVGAGPGGAWLAALLAEAGIRCVVVDRSRFPRFKVCGGCLSARTLEELAPADIDTALVASGGHRLLGLRLRGWRRKVELPLPPGLAVSRELLDSLLLRQAIERGAHFLAGHRVVLDELLPSRRRLRLGAVGAPRLEAAVVVDATGLGGSLIADSSASRSGGGSKVGCSIVLSASHGFEPGVVHMAVGAHGYVGAAVLEGDRLNLAAALDRRAVRRFGPAATASEILRAAGFPVPDALNGAGWSGTPALRHRPATRAAERLFAVGDAAGYVAPFTGEGIGWALRSATLLAPLVVDAARQWSHDLIGAWNDVYRGELGRRQRGCRALAWLLRHPAAARGALAVLERRPELGAPLVRRLHGPELLGAEGSRA